MSAGNDAVCVRLPKSLMLVLRAVLVTERVSQSELVRAALLLHPAVQAALNPVSESTHQKASQGGAKRITKQRKRQSVALHPIAVTSQDNRCNTDAMGVIPPNTTEPMENRCNTTEIEPAKNEKRSDLGFSDLQSVPDLGSSALVRGSFPSQALDPSPKIFQDPDLTPDPTGTVPEVEAPGVPATAEEPPREALALTLVDPAERRTKRRPPSKAELAARDAAGKPRREDPPAVKAILAAGETAKEALALGDPRGWDRRAFQLAARRLEDHPDLADWRTLGTYLREIERPSPALTPFELVRTSNRFDTLMEQAKSYADQLEKLGGGVLRLPRFLEAELDRIGSNHRLHVGDESAMLGLTKFEVRELLRIQLIPGNADEKTWTDVAEWIKAGGCYWLDNPLSLRHLSRHGTQWLTDAKAWSARGKPSLKNAMRRMPAQGPARGEAYEAEKDIDPLAYIQAKLAQHKAKAGGAA